MKLLKKILLTTGILTTLLGFSQAQVAPFSVKAGGTGASSLPCGILSASGTTPFKKVNLGTGINYDCISNTLSASSTGGGNINDSEITLYSTAVSKPTAPVLNTDFNITSDGKVVSLPSNSTSTITGKLNVFDVGGGVWLSSQGISPSVIQKSIDNGVTWNTVFSTTTGNANIFSRIPNTNTIIAEGDSIRTLISNDNGNNWSVNLTTPNSASLSIVSRTNAVIIGYSSDLSGIWKSADNGVTFTQKLSNLNILSFLDTGTSILAFTQGQGIKISNDNGETWTNTGLTTSNFRNGTMVGSNIIVTSNIGVYTSTDGINYTLVNGNTNFGAITSQNGIIYTYSITDANTYISINNGATFTLLGNFGSPIGTSNFSRNSSLIFFNGNSIINTTVLNISLKWPSSPIGANWKSTIRFTNTGVGTYSNIVSDVFVYNPNSSATTTNRVNYNPLNNIFTSTVNNVSATTSIRENINDTQLTFFSTSTFKPTFDFNTDINQNLINLESVFLPTATSTWKINTGDGTNFKWSVNVRISSILGDYYPSIADVLPYSTTTPSTATSTPYNNPYFDTRPTLATAINNANSAFMSVDTNNIFVLANYNLATTSFAGSNTLTLTYTSSGLIPQNNLVGGFITVVNASGTQPTTLRIASNTQVALSGDTLILTFETELPFTISAKSQITLARSRYAVAMQFVAQNGIDASTIANTFQVTSATKSYTNISDNAGRLMIIRFTSIGVSGNTVILNGSLWDTNSATNFIAMTGTTQNGTFYNNSTKNPYNTLKTGDKVVQDTFLLPSNDNNGLQEIELLVNYSDGTSYNYYVEIAGGSGGGAVNSLTTITQGFKNTLGEELLPTLLNGILNIPPNSAYIAKPTNFNITAGSFATNSLRVPNASFLDFPVGSFVAWRYRNDLQYFLVTGATSTGATFTLLLNATPLLGDVGNNLMYMTINREITLGNNLSNDQGIINLNIKSADWARTQVWAYNKNVAFGTADGFTTSLYAHNKELWRGGDATDEINYNITPTLPVISDVFSAIGGGVFSNDGSSVVIVKNGTGAISYYINTPANLNTFINNSLSINNGVSGGVNGNIFYAVGGSTFNYNVFISNRVAGTSGSGSFIPQYNFIGTQILEMAVNPDGSKLAITSLSGGPANQITLMQFYDITNSGGTLSFTKTRDIIINTQSGFDGDPYAIVYGANRIVYGVDGSGNLYTYNGDTGTYILKMANFVPDQSTGNGDFQGQYNNGYVVFSSDNGALNLYNSTLDNFPYYGGIRTYLITQPYMAGVDVNGNITLIGNNDARDTVYRANPIFNPKNTFLAPVEVGGQTIQVNGNSGTNGQVLSSTGSGVSWVDGGFPFRYSQRVYPSSFYNSSIQGAAQNLTPTTNGNITDGSVTFGTGSLTQVTGNTLTYTLNAGVYDVDIRAFSNNVQNSSQYIFVCSQTETGLFTATPAYPGGCNSNNVLSSGDSRQMIFGNNKLTLTATTTFSVWIYSTAQHNTRFVVTITKYQ